MTNRRRNVLVLLFVAGLAIASLAVALTTKPRLGLDLRGGIELVYQAKPTPNAPVIQPDTLDRTIDIMRTRVDPTGTLEPEIQTSGENQITVALPGFQEAEKAERLVGKTARLYFYDWEPNVIGPDGKPDPENSDVTGAGTASGAGGPETALSKFAAVNRAARRAPEDTKNRSHDGLFYLVDEANKRVVAGPANVEDDLYSEDEAEAAKQKKDYKVVAIPKGTTVLQAEAPRVRSGADQGRAPARQDKWYVLRDEVALEGADIKDPVQSQDQLGLPAVSFDFTSDGRKIWEDVTRQIAQRGQEQQIGGTGAQHFAIALDNQLVSVPQIDPIENPDGISGANGSQISGSFTLESSRELADLLRTGALPVDLELISQSQISATLGQQALDEAVVAGGLGFLIVAIFLVLFYRVLGVLAVVGLTIYSLFLYALILLIPITLTLPGIAGVILTIGVAADANIVIFERIKEEMRSGRSVQTAISVGYKRGLTAIIDANVVTFLVAFILFTLATAGVKGFAFMLGVGTLVSFFTAVVFTQAVLGLLGGSKMLAGKSAFGAGIEKQPRRFDFMGRSKIFFSLSGVILAIGAFGIGTQGVPLGIDFESGTKINTTFEKQTTEDQLRAFVEDQGLPDAKIQRVQAEGGQAEFQITLPSLQPQRVNSFRAALDNEFGVGAEFASSTVGPTFGEQIAKTAIIAIFASLLVISAYIALRFEWKYSVPVLIAVTHDILIVAGVYALLGAEVTSATVAALLTILGYSLYDTIIVFDRIRENVPRMPRATYSQVVNQSMSEVLIRSLATSFCTLLPVTALYLFGGETLQDFALALIIGTLSGVYSSIFIAGPVLVHWKEREPAWRRRIKAVKASHGGVVPPYADAPKAALVEQADAGPVRLSSDQPDAVSDEEFQAMVRDLDIEEAAAADARAKKAAKPASSSTAVADEKIDPNDPRAVRRAEARKRREQRQPRGEED